METKTRFILNVLFFRLIILIIWAFGKFILPVLVPFIIAFVIASVLQILVRRVCRGNEALKKPVSLVTCIAFFALVVWLLGLFSVKTFSSVTGFLQMVPSFYQNELVPTLTALGDELYGMLDTVDVALAQQISMAFQDFVGNIGNYLTTFSVNALKIISGSIVGIPAFIIRLIVTVISTFFWMADYDRIIAFGKRCIPKGKEGAVESLIGYVKMTIFVYLKSYTILCILTFVELSIGFSLLGIPYPILLGLAVAIFDIMPILGVGGVLLPWAVVLLLMKNIPMAIGMVLLYLFITIVRNTVEPKVVGKQIGLHPLATLISMYLGLKLVGILGMFIFPVTLTIMLGMKSSGSQKAQETAAAKTE